MKKTNVKEVCEANIFDLAAANEAFCKLLKIKMIPESNIFVKNNYAVLVLSVRNFNENERVYIHVYVYSNVTKEIVCKEVYKDAPADDMRKVKKLITEYAGRGKNIEKFL